MHASETGAAHNNSRTKSLDKLSRGVRVKVIDIDSHSNPRNNVLAIDPEYMHIGPNAYIDGNGTRVTILNNKIIQIFRNDEKKISYKSDIDGKAAHYDASVRYREV